MNGLQTLTQWESAFNYPSGGKLGLLSAIQVTSMVWSAICPPSLTHAEHWVFS